MLSLYKRRYVVCVCARCVLCVFVFMFRPVLFVCVAVLWFCLYAVCLLYVVCLLDVAVV